MELTYSIILLLFILSLLTQQNNLSRVRSLYNKSGTNTGSFKLDYLYKNNIDSLDAILVMNTNYYRINIQMELYKNNDSKNKQNEIMNLISNRFRMEPSGSILSGSRSMGSLIKKKYFSKKMISTYMHNYIFPEEKC